MLVANIAYGIVHHLKSIFRTLLFCLVLSSNPIICSTLAFLSSRISVVPDSIDFPSNSEGDAPFHHLAYDYSFADWESLGNYLRDVLWKDTFELGASAVSSEFCEWMQVGIDAYIPCQNYQVRAHLFTLWLSSDYAAAISS